jgi:hypothetical protein
MEQTDRKKQQQQQQQQQQTPMRFVAALEIIKCCY